MTAAAALDAAVRAGGGRIVAALAARWRDLDVAEECFAEACARAAETWPCGGAPRDPAGWLYRTADRCALDAWRRRRTAARHPPEPPAPEPTVEDAMAGDAALIPDERLRLIFVCCHPAVAADARAALTLRLVCGVSTERIARAFLVAEPTLAQRLVRAKRKIAEAGVPFEIPGPDAWLGRLDAVLSTLEVAYAQAYEDAAGAGPHAGNAAEMLELTRVLADLLPDEGEALALAAMLRFAEARRPARVDAAGVMVPLSQQDPRLWNRAMIADGATYLRRAETTASAGARAIQATIHGVWCARADLDEPPPWPRVLALYDALLGVRDDIVVHLNRAVALAEVAGPGAALSEVEALDGPDRFAPLVVARADLLRRVGRTEEARAAYDAALSLGPPPAERRWLERRLSGLA